MPIYIGNQKLGSLYLGSTKIKEAWVGDVKVYGSGDPYNPLNLPPYTLRIKYTLGTPTGSFDSVTSVDPQNNIWDVTKNSSDWSNLFSGMMFTMFLTEVLGVNSTGVTNMSSLFDGCRTVPSFPLFDTTLVTNMSYMFRACTMIREVPLYDTRNVVSMNRMFSQSTNGNLTSIPQFDLTSVTDMDYMFYRQGNVASGLLEFYNRASNKSVQVTNHAGTFEDCGIYTQTGLAELQQIPESWGGLAPD